MHLMAREWWATAAIVGLLGCGSQSLPTGPILAVSPTSFNYLSDVDYAVLIGEQPAFSLQILDPAQNPLTVKSVTLADANNVFTLAMPVPAGFSNNDAGMKTLINTSPPDAAVVTLYFAPKAAKVYDATVTITSDGINDGGTAVVAIHALGVDPDAGIPADAGLTDAGQ